MHSLPTYDLGPGHESDELVINVILYGMATALLLSMAWVVLMPLAQTLLERRRNR
ncbi:MAG: hypothetical protein QOI82_400 [Actinomycetota bacterium]|jgi:hypothetical protein|nr:hypothetical protein [Actinomycetota bacterium]